MLPPCWSHNLPSSRCQLQQSMLAAPGSPAQVVRLTLISDTIDLEGQTSFCEALHPPLQPRQHQSRVLALPRRMWVPLAEWEG